ncbi:MAG: NUDIX hydrolase [Rhizobiales bacterium]|nr:NUDIX hydrolase [Hyphomicrobiales bacterium]
MGVDGDHRDRLFARQRAEHGDDFAVSQPVAACARRLDLDQVAGLRAVQIFLVDRQFRLPVYLASGAEEMLEACAGVLDGDEDAETCIRREAEEEMGFRLRDLRRLYSAYTIPGSVTEKVTFFTARYAPADRVSAGGGHPDEGEDIEVVEMTLDDAFTATRDGRIVDAKTILLIQECVLAKG